MKKVKSIFSMGGGVFKGNITPVAEFNYWFDAQAVDMVYDKLGKYVPIHMIGLDLTHQVVVDQNDLEFMNLEGGERGKLIYEMTKDYVKSYWEFNKIMGIVIHDLTTIIGYIHPELFTKVYHANLRCVTDENIAKGQCIIDLLDNWGLEKNVFVPMAIDHNQYKEKMMGLLFDEKVREQYVKYVLKKEKKHE
jgi:inosine-uridine nucleoside N-ribohydrolase